MNNLCKFVLVAICLTLAMSVVSCKKDNTEDPGNTPKAKYTIMLYGCGGGDIDMQLEDALEGLVKGLGTEKNQVRYTVMYSMSAANKDFKDTYRGELGKTYRYELSKDTDLTQAGYRRKYFYKNASEVELYKASTLADFIQWSMKTAPAENYIAEVLKNAGIHLKAIYWNGCMMGQLEVLTEVAPYCDYQFSSSHVAYTDNNHVVSFVNAINAEPDDFEKAALAHKQLMIGKGETDESSFLYSYLHSYNQKTKKEEKVNGDFGCWRSAKLSAINEQVKKLGAFLVKVYKPESEKSNVDNATSWVYLYEMSYGYADVLDYAQKVADAISDQALKAEAQTIAADLKKAIADANVYRINCVNIQSADKKLVTTKEGGFSLGISLYAGKVSDDWQYASSSANYKASAFDKAVGWSKWMDINEFRVSADQDHPNLTNPGNDTSWELFWLNDHHED